LPASASTSAQTFSTSTESIVTSMGYAPNARGSLRFPTPDCLTARRQSLGSPMESSAMPIYEYDCPDCGRFEVIQKRSDAPLTKHDCGKKVKKLMSASAFSFKGSGFYSTDYKNSSSPSAGRACEKPKGEGCSSCPSSSGREAAA